MELYKKEMAIFCTTCHICKSGGDCSIFEKYCHPKKFKGIARLLDYLCSSESTG